MNLLDFLAVYGTLCKETGAKFRCLASPPFLTLPPPQTLSVNCIVQKSAIAVPKCSRQSPATATAVCAAAFSSHVLVMSAVSNYSTTLQAIFKACMRYINAVQEISRLRQDNL